MELRKFLSEFSESIFRLEGDGNIGMQAYRRNLFGLVYGQFSEYFEATLNYVGDDNFSFLVREFVRTGNMKSPNIIEVAAGFPEFLQSTMDIHGDEKLRYLAQLDFYRAQSNLDPVEIQFPRGIVEFWSQILLGQNPDQTEVDLETADRFSVSVRNGELAIKPV